jgi:predicted nucleotidyltransferase
MKWLEGKYPVREAILFGSRARGDHRPDSDADIAVILKARKATATRSPATWRVLNFTS